MNYHNEIDAVLRYSGGDTQDVRDFLHTLSQPEHADTLLGRGQHDVRMIAADAFEEAGREGEARLLRSGHPVAVEQGSRIAPLKWRHLDPFTRSYIDTALWSSVPHHEGNPEGRSLEETHSTDDIHPITLAEMATDCRNFREGLPQHLQDALNGEDPERAGADFWLSRNGHGSGYFDGDRYGESRDEDGDYHNHSNELQDHARMWGEYNLEPDEDGKIHGY